MKILYFGETDKNGTAWQRVEAMRRLGHQVMPFDPAEFIPSFPFLDSFNVRTGFRFVASRVARGLLQKIKGLNWDVVWIDAGAELSPAFHRSLRAYNKPIISYVIDNPFVRRDYRKWDLYKKCLPLHDLTVLKCDEQVHEAQKLGASNAISLLLCYDPVAHSPPAVKEVKHDVMFVGSWMPERGAFMVSLLQKGVPLTIVGNAWQRAPEWKKLRHCWQGPSIYGREYVDAIASSRIALGLLSKGNRDYHTSRSLEIPFIGGAVFCAERTPLHKSMYEEDGEAIFWETPEECADKCTRLLADPEGCQRMARRARQKVIQLKRSNDEVIALILSKAQICHE